jgi:hypothetical protein
LVGAGEVLLFNSARAPATLEGCALLDEEERRQPLRKAVIKPGHARLVRLSGKTARLGARGGLLTLVDGKGLKIHGVSYSSKHVGKGHRSIVFPGA